MLDKSKYPIASFWIYSDDPSCVKPSLLDGWAKATLTEEGQQILNNGLHLRAYSPERGIYAVDIEECLRALVQAGELMDFREPLPIPNHLPSRSELQIRFGKQLQDLHFGIACEDGWNALLYVMFDAVEQAQLRGEVPENFQWRQIKEKFGTIRLYYPPNLPLLEQLSHCIETASGKTCEVCGAPGTLFTDGWHKARCPAHENS